MYDPGVSEELAMKALITGGLCAALGLAAAQGFAQEPPRPAVGSFQRVAPAANPPTNPAVRLSRPIPVGERPVSEGVAPATYNTPPATALDGPTPLYRAQAPDLDASHQLMPLGPYGKQP